MTTKRQLDEETTPIERPTKKRRLNDFLVDDNENEDDNEDSDNQSSHSESSDNDNENDVNENDANKNDEDENDEDEDEDEDEKNGHKNESAKDSTKTKPKTASEIEEDKLSKWSNLEVGTLTKRAIDKLGFSTMMEIQYKAIPPVLVCCYIFYNIT